MILLKNKTDIFVAEGGPFLGFQMMNSGVVEKIFTAPAVIVHSENVKQRRFSGARWPHHRNELALRNFEVDVAQYEKEFPFRQRIRTFEIVKLDHHALWLSAIIGSARVARSAGI